MVLLWRYLDILGGQINPQESFPSGTVVKNLPANTGEAGLILGWEDPLEEEMATHSSILAQKIPWTEGSSMLQSMGSQESDTT